jgi:peptidoglycan/xylan/chitin deacetylase (PgdA/CDA1 family)
VSPRRFALSLALVAAALLTAAAPASADTPPGWAPPGGWGPASGPLTDVTPFAPPFARAAGERRLPIGCRRGGNPFRLNGPRNKKVVALTFDDGPGPYTSDIIGILVRMKAKGTFFVLGTNIPGYERQLQRQIAWGFEIGNHSFNHPQYPSSSQLAQTNQRIKRAADYTPCVFRPPYGAVNRSLIGRARSQGMMTINWDVDPQDWATPGSGAIYSRIVNNARSGSIILMHDGGGNRSQTVAALPRVIRTLRARGYKFATVTELLGHKFVYADTE